MAREVPIRQSVFLAADLRIISARPMNARERKSHGY